MTMAKHIFLIVIDGLRDDYLRDYLNNDISSVPKSGFRLMGLDKNRFPTRKIEALGASTVFPSITICANASIITGLYPRHHGIVGNIFYQRDKNRLVNFESMELAPTLYGCFDEFYKKSNGDLIPWVERANWTCVLHGKQETGPGCSGPDVILAENRIKTVYDILQEHGHPSHVIYHFYSKGAGYRQKGLAYRERLDGWDTPTNREMLFQATLGSNNEQSFFESFDSKSAEKAKDYIENFPEDLSFPSLFTIYFASVDHACHIKGIVYQEGDVVKYTQSRFLLEIDIKLYDVINAYKERFPQEMSQTIFIITSDHGHEMVDPFLNFPASSISDFMMHGLFNVKYSHVPDDEFPTSIQFDEFVRSRVKIAANGTMAHIYFTDNLTDFVNIDALLANLCCNFGIGTNTKAPILVGEGEDAKSQFLPTKPSSVSMILKKGLDGKYYKCHVNVRERIFLDREAGTSSILYDYDILNTPDPFANIVTEMLANNSSSGDILILLNQKDGYQFAGTQPHADTLSIPFTDYQDFRIPFGESFNSRSTHGSIETMQVPLILVGELNKEADYLELQMLSILYPQF